MNTWNLGQYTLTQQEAENRYFPVSVWGIKDNRDDSYVDIEFYTPQFRRWLWGKNESAYVVEYLLGWLTITIKKNRDRPKRRWER